MRNSFVVDHALEIIFVFDPKGNILYANQSAEEKLGFAGGLRTRKVWDVFPTAFEEQGNGFDTTFEFGEEPQQIMAYRGNKTCFRAQARIFYFTEEDIPQYICMVKDVSEQYVLEKKVEQVHSEAENAMKIKSEFVANVTHELRTPVNGILGNVRQLIGEEDDPKKLNTLHVVERGCNDMHNIINNVLDFSKLEAGKFTLEMRPFNFRNMIDYVKANHINKITEKGLDFFVTISPEIPEEIIGDELRVVQILNNLLSNATKFTSVGKVTLEVLKTAQQNNRVELFFMVIDTGIGIDKADEDKLFKSFSQVDASISRKFGGTGLGLNICKQLVELMYGSISVESEKGKGTMFSFSVWFDLPEGTECSSKVDEGVNTHSVFEHQDEQDVKEFGSADNLDNLNRQLSKLILSVEMENWEKAEMFMEVIRQLTEVAPREVKSAVLRLKMAVQKADYDKTIAGYEKVQAELEALGGEENGK